MHVQAASMKHMRIAIKHMSILPLNLSPHLLAIFAVQELASRCHHVKTRLIQEVCFFFFKIKLKQVGHMLPSLAYASCPLTLQPPLT